MKNIECIENILLDGYNLSLNFTNTIKDRLADTPHDYLTGKEEWIAWLKKVKLLKKTSDLSEGQAFDLVEIIQTRELIHRIFQGFIYRMKLNEKDLLHFEKEVLKVRKSTKISITDNKAYEVLELNVADLNTYLLPILKSAHELLLSDDIVYVKECGNCGWLFLDTCKNKKRKWCNMKTCGSAIKGKRYYQNKKKFLKENIKPY